MQHNVQSLIDEVQVVERFKINRTLETKVDFAEDPKE